MATKLLVVSAAILVLGIISETAAQYRNAGYGYGYGHQSHPYYQQPRPPFGGYRQPVYQQQVPGGVSVQEAEWVCKNPKTGDVMIISSEDVPTTNTGGTVQQQWQQQPKYPQPSFPEPTAPPPTPNYPTPSPQQPSTGSPNTNGEGLIEIRTRQ